MLAGQASTPEKEELSDVATESRMESMNHEFTLFSNSGFSSSSTSFQCLSSTFDMIYSALTACSHASPDQRLPHLVSESTAQVPSVQGEPPMEIPAIQTMMSIPSALDNEELKHMP